MIHLFSRMQVWYIDNKETFTISPLGWPYCEMEGSNVIYE